MRGRRATITRAKAIAPDAYQRVLDTCQFAAVDVDLEEHAAQIVLAAHDRPTQVRPEKGNTWQISQT